MTLVSANDLADMRATQLSSMNKSCTISRPTRSTTTTGGQSGGTPSTANTVCRVTPGGSPTRGGEGGKVTEKMQWTITLPYNTTIAAGDTITVGSQAFLVVGFPNDQSFLTAIPCRCVEK